MLESLSEFLAPPRVLAILAFLRGAFCAAAAATLAYQARWQLLGFTDRRFVAYMERHNIRPDNAAHHLFRGSLLDRAGRPLAYTDPDGSGRRVYPYEAATAHVVGFRHPSEGLNGIEGAADDLLSGWRALATAQDVREAGRTAFEAARRSVDGAACNLFPESWGGMLSDRKFKRRFAAGAAGALAAWLALVGVLFGWPAALSVREASLQKEVDRLSPEEAVVDQFRSRIRIIDRYSDRTWSPLEVLREVAVALPQGVTLTMFRQEAAKREALVEAAARSSAPAYEFSNRLKSSPLFSRNDIVAGPTENRNTGRTSFQLRLLFAEPGEGGVAP